MVTHAQLVELAWLIFKLFLLYRLITFAMFMLHTGIKIYFNERDKHRTANEMQKKAKVEGISNKKPSDYKSTSIGFCTTVPIDKK